jgi:Tfp pilus assembly protein PilN
MAIRVVNRAGCKPYLMDIKPLALARLSPEANAIIIDVQAKEFDIINILNGIPQPIRTVSFPREKLTLPEKFAIVKDDVLRTVRFYNENSAESPIKADTTMLVSGELAGAPELYESLAGELGLKASLLASPLKSVKPVDASHYLVNAGLALKELTQKGTGALSPRFNTLPAPYQPKRVSLKQVMAVPAGALAAALIALMAMSAQDTAADIDSMNTQMMTNNFTLEKRLAQKQGLLKNINELQSEIAAFESQYDAWDAAYIKMNSAGDLMNTDLKTIAAGVVEDLFLTHLAHSSGQVTIEGQSSSEQEVLDYVRILQDTGRFDEITITGIDRNEPDGEPVNHTFSLKCRLKEGRP